MIPGIKTSIENWREHQINKCILNFQVLQVEYIKISQKLRYWCTPWKIYHWVFSPRTISKAGGVWKCLLYSQESLNVVHLLAESKFYINCDVNLEILPLGKDFHAQWLKLDGIWTACQISSESLKSVGHSFIDKSKSFKFSTWKYLKIQN